jgi:hypothetical protein
MLRINKKTGKRIVYSSLPLVCRFDGCNGAIRRDNRSGVCKIHRSKPKFCKRCLVRCHFSAEMCQKCRSKDKADGSSFVVCWYEGCVKRVRNRYGYCQEHFKLGGQCEANVRSGGRCQMWYTKAAKFPYCGKHHSSSNKFRSNE